MDASIITAPSSTKNRTGERDPEMRQTKKGNQWYFGMKAHIGVDAASGLAHRLATTPANASDVATAHALLHGGEERVWGDAGYQGVGKREENRDAAVAWEVAMKPGQRRLLDKKGPEAAAERRKASVRAKVEHPFLYVKRHFGYAKVRYRGWRRTRSASPCCSDFPTCSSPALRRRLTRGHSVRDRRKAAGDGRDGYRAGPEAAFIDTKAHPRWSAVFHKPTRQPEYSPKPDLFRRSLMNFPIKILATGPSLRL